MELRGEARGEAHVSMPHQPTCKVLDLLGRALRTRTEIEELNGRFAS